MHVADQLFVEAFEVQIEGEPLAEVYHRITTVEALAYITGGS
jgi:hypothetical protein